MLPVDSGGYSVQQNSIFILSARKRKEILNKLLFDKKSGLDLFQHVTDKLREFLENGYYNNAIYLYSYHDSFVDHGSVYKRKFDYI